MTKRRPPTASQPSGTRRRSLGNPGAPSDPRGRWSRQAGGYVGGAPEVALLLALIDAVLSQGSLNANAEARFETAILREQARAGGFLSAASRYLPKDADPATMKLFTLPHSQALDALLGYHDEHGDWQPGQAALTQQESKAMDHLIDGMEPWEIAREMTPQRVRRFEQPWLEVDTVERYLRTARGKLRGLLDGP